MNPMYPGFPQQPYPQQQQAYPQAQPQQPTQGYPPQQPGYPAQMVQQPGYPMAQPIYGAPGGAVQPPAPAPGGFYIPEEAAILEDYRQAREKLGSFGPKAVFVKWLGPQGQTKWRDVNVGYASTIPVYILPAPQPQPGQPPTGFFLEVPTHFWKSAAHPQGKQIGCPGDGCLICAAREAGLGHPDPQVQKRAKEFGRTRTQYFYQVVMLQYPQAHMMEDGKMRPHILAATRSLHAAIGEVVQARGIAKIIDPTNGRPVMLRKTKTGKQDRDVEYHAIDGEPMPLPSVFYPVLQNLWNLREFLMIPSQQDMMMAVQEMALPMPGQQFNPAPQAPWPNPHQAPQQFTGFQPMQQPLSFQGGQGGYPNQTPGYLPQPQGQLQYLPPGDPYQFPPPEEGGYGAPQGLMPQPPPPMTPMPAQQFQYAQPQAQPQVMGPPPVTSSPVGSAPPPTSYMPQQGFAGQVQQPPPMNQAAQNVAVGPPPAPSGVQMPPPVQMGAPMPQVASTAPRALSIPVQGVLPDARERCFGKFDRTGMDPACATCPEWIKTQCTAQTPMAGSVQPTQAQTPEKLQQLQAQLVGQVR